MYCPTTFETAPITRACAVAFTTRDDDMFFVVVCLSEPDPSRP